MSKINNYTPYQQTIRECFATAYNFLDKYKHVRTDRDWDRISDAMCIMNVQSYKDHPLLIDLMNAVLDELEREQEAAIAPFESAMLNIGGNGKVG